MKKLDNLTKDSLIATDGCVSDAGTISLCINDLDLLEKVKTVLGSEHKITPAKYQKGLLLERKYKRFLEGIKRNRED